MHWRRLGSGLGRRHERGSRRGLDWLRLLQLLRGRDLREGLGLLRELPLSKKQGVLPALHEEHVLEGLGRRESLPHVWVQQVHQQAQRDGLDSSHSSHIVL